MNGCPLRERLSVMGNRPWKEFERNVAKGMGGTRVGPSGVDTNDVSHEHFAIECKYRKDFPQWIKDGLAQADKGDGRTPILFLREKRAKKTEDIVCVWASDFYDWFGLKP